jgi:hypothetical protein
MLGREVVAMVEFNPGGSGRAPHDPDAQRDHERDLREMAERDHLAAEAERATPRRCRWCSFWRRWKR